MTASLNGSDPTVTVENEKQVVTIGNTKSSTASKPMITMEKEKEILDEIERHCCYWRKIGNAYIAAILVFGTAAVSTSVLVSIYTGSDEHIMKITTIKVMACISTISLAILTAFNLVSNGNNARNAWRSLNAALMLYTAGSISLQQLIEQYQKGENQLGSLSFSYGTNSETPATYAHEISASDEERKLKAADKKLKEGENMLKNGSTSVEKLIDKTDDTEEPEEIEETKQ